MEKILQEKIENFSALLNISNDPIMIIKADGTILDINEAAAKSVNSNASELVGLSVYNVLPQEVAALRKSYFDKSILTRAVVCFEDVRNERNIENTVYPVIDSGREVVRLIIMARDITARIQASAKLRFYGEIISNMEEGVLLVRVSDDIIVYANPKMENMFGYQHNELEGKHISIVNMPTDISPKETVLKIKKTLEKYGGWTGEIRNIRKDGTQFWSRATVSSFEHHAFGPVWLAVHQDITEYKKTEEELHKSEEKYKLLMQNSPEPIMWADTNGNQIGANKAAEILLGYTRDELVSRHISQNHPPEAIEDVKAIFQAVNASDNVPSYFRDVPMMRKDGSVVYVDLSGSYIVQDGNKILQVVFKDVTERKKAYDELAGSEEKYRTLFDNLKQTEEKVRQSAAEQKAILDNIACGVFYLKNRMFQWANRSAAELLGYSLDEITGKDMSVFYPDRESYEQSGREAYPLLAQGKIYSIERQMKKKSGELMWCSIIGQAIYPADLEEGAIWLLEDITERKRLEEDIVLANKTLEKRVAERTNDLNLIIDQLKIEIKNRIRGAGALKKSEHRYKRLLESVTSYVYTVNFKKGQPVNTFHGPGCEAVTGYTSAEYSANPLLWHSMIHKDDIDKVMEQVSELHLGANAPTIEHRIIRKNGSMLWIESTLVPTFDSGGQLISYDGIITNINDRKIAQEALQRANAYNRSLFEASPDPLVTIGADGKITDVNSALEVMTGCFRKDIIGTDFSDYFIEPELARTAYLKAFKEGLTQDLPLELKHREGHNTSVLYNATVYRNESGQVIGVFAAARDISERKRLEREISEISSQERRNIGNELHDEVGQSLTGISFLCKVLEQRFSERKSDDYRDIQKIKEGLNEVIKKVRDISRDISAFKVSEGDIQSALQGLAIRTKEIYNVKCSLDCDVGFQVGNGIITEQLYYIASEAAANAAKHGKPENIHINLYCTDKKINIAVEDDGAGFNPDKDHVQGMGIRIMKYRAGIIGATFDIKRTTDGKTVVSCSVNL